MEFAARLRAADRAVTVQPPDGFDGKAYTGDGAGDQQRRARRATWTWTAWGSPTPRRAIIEWLEAHGHGEGTVTYRLRDWLFSRQRYWGEPFPIVYDEDGARARAARVDAAAGAARGRGLLAAHLRPGRRRHAARRPRCRGNEDWVEVELDLGDGAASATAARPTPCPTGPAPAGTSCATWTRPTPSGWSTRRSSSTGWARATAGRRGGVDLYVGGAEHAVLHLLYARFWHKVLYDLGHVSSVEPFHKLFNQGMIQAYATATAAASPCRPPRSRSATARYFYQGETVSREYWARWASP